MSLRLSMPIYVELNNQPQNHVFSNNSDLEAI